MFGKGDYMKFRLNKASNWRQNKEIEVVSLEDLQKIQEQYGRELIIDFSDKTIVIYDSYIE